MRKIVAVVLCITAIGCFAQQSHQDTDFREFFVGYWFFRPQLPERTMVLSFSWGSAETASPDYSFIIDKSGDEFVIYLPDLGGPFKISSIDRISEDTYLLRYYFDRGRFDVEQVLHYDSEADAFWVESTPLLEGASGQENVWYRLSGP